MKKIKKAILVTLIAALCSAFTFAEDAASSTSDWAQLQAKFTQGGNITLDKNYTAGSEETCLIVPKNTDVVLDLNGHTIDRGLSNSTEAVQDGCVIKVAGDWDGLAELTINDSSTTKTGKITGGNNQDNGGGISVKFGTVTINEGSICGNHSAMEGGAIYVHNSTLTISGGKLFNNTAEYGGVISGETEDVIINGGIISGNKATYGGGAIIVYGYLTITGGTITGNTSINGRGSGVYSYYGNVSVSGKCKIFGNYKNGTFDESTGKYTGTENDNIYCSAGLGYGMSQRIIKILDSLDDEAEIWVTVNEPRVFTENLSYHPDAISHFHSDDSDYEIITNSDGEAEIKIADRKITAVQDPYTPGTYYATYYFADNNKKFKANCEVYYAKTPENGVVQLEKVENGVIISGNGVILKSTSASIVLTPTTDDPSTNYSDNCLLGFNTSDSIPKTGEHSFILTLGDNGLRFYPYEGPIEANKAYLRVFLPKN